MTLEPGSSERWTGLFARLCGSAPAAQRAMRPLLLRVMGWRAIDRWRDSDDDLLCRAWLERPNLVNLGGLTLDHDASPLARVLAHEPCESWIVWALVTLGGLPIATLSRLSGHSVLQLREQLDTTRELLRRRSHADVLLVGRDPSQLVELERVLTSGGHVVSGRAASRPDLVAYGAPSQIDLVVSDLDAAGGPLDGSMVEDVQQRFTAAQVLLVTESSAPVPRILPPRCIAVMKPVEPIELLDRCAEAVLDVFPYAGTKPDVP